MEGSGSFRQRGCVEVKHAMVSKPMASITKEAGQGCISNSESMATSDSRDVLEVQAARLEKNVINLSIEESTSYQVPVERHDGTGIPVLSADHPSPLCDNLANLKPTAQFSKGWKRIVMRWDILCRGIQ